MSKLVHPKSSLPIGTADENQQLSLTFYLYPEPATEKNQERFNNLFTLPPSKRKYLSYTEYKKLFSLSKKTIAHIEEYAKTNDLSIGDINTVKRTIVVTGSIEQLKRAMNTSFNLYQQENNEFGHQLYMSASGEVELPKETAELVGHIDGLTKNHVKEKRPGYFAKVVQTPTGTVSGYLPTQVAEAYNYPEGDGKKECIGLIELGGTFTPHDIETYFNQFDIPVPEIEIVGAPTTIPTADSLEVTADIQAAGSIVPKAKIVIYYGNTILEGLKSALSDPNNSPSVLSISWAGSEYSYSTSEIEEINIALYEANLRGMTVLSASGDYGAMDAQLKPKSVKTPAVNIPASSPFVVACGGTELHLNGSSIQSEKVWYQTVKNPTTGQTVVYGSGGGFSHLFVPAEYQKKAINNYLTKFPAFAPYYNRAGVPDISANAANSTGYTLLFNNQWLKIGGTSLSTPVIAALIIRLNQHLGYRAGFLNSILYDLESSDAFLQITEGNNGVFPASEGWNAATGLGSPNGQNLLNAIAKL